MRAAARPAAHKNAAAEPARTTRKAPAQERSSLFVGSAEKAFQVLEAFSGGHRRMSMAEIARTAQLDRSATQRIVYTLEKLGYLHRIPDSLGYGLTSKVLNLSYNFLRANELIDKASPYLLDISRALGETANLQELDGYEIVFLARFPGQHLVNLDFAVGSRLPAVFTASGTAILSRLPEAERVEILRRTPLQPITPHTEVDPRRLLARIEAAAAKGYAIVANETVLGDISVAAPIIGRRGEAIGAINVSVPTTRWTPEAAEARLVAHVQVAATSISQSKFGDYVSP